MNVGRLKYDVFFKKVFYKKHLMKAFLNTVLASELQDVIHDLSYEPTDFIVQGTAQRVQRTKHDVIDVFCITEHNQRVLVELQKGYNTTAMPRFLDYQCRNYSSQFPTGSDYSPVVPCYSICWFFDLQPPHSQVKETITLSSDCAPTHWNFDWEIIALYPRNIPPEHIEQQTIDALEEWLLLDVVDDVMTASKIQQLLHTQEVKEAFYDLDLSTLSEDQVRRLIFDEQLHEHKDLFEEKLQERDRQRDCELAKKLLLSGDSVEKVLAITSLQQEEVEQLQRELLS